MVFMVLYVRGREVNLLQDIKVLIPHFHVDRKSLSGEVSCKRNSSLKFCFV